MKVLHLPFSYFPDRVGGTEIYVATLAAELAALGVESMVAAPATDGATAHYSHADVPVYRYVIERDLGPADLYGAGTQMGAEAIARILDDERPDVVHVHALTFGVSLTVMRAARARGIPVVLTYHTPTVTCQQGTLLRNGREGCDGVMEVRRCTSCTLRNLGASELAAEMISRLPVSVAALGLNAGLRGRAWTALQMPALMQRRHDAARTALAEVSAIVAVSAWVRDLLVANGVPEEKIVLSRQGITYATPERPAFEPPRRDAPVRAVVVTRLDPVKGVHLLIEALVGAPELALVLDVYGVAQNASQERYAERLRALAANDPRIRFLPPLATDAVVPTLTGYDVLLVSSLMLETGPLVVLEAFAAGIPVIGTGNGGIAERVRHEVDGLLVEPVSVPAWRETLRRVTTEPGLLARLRRGVRAPRTMTEVAVEMAALYRRLAPPRYLAAPVGVPAEHSA